MVFLDLCCDLIFGDSWHFTYKKYTDKKEKKIVLIFKEIQMERLQSHI
jgi:hypothetical protein